MKSAGGGGGNLVKLYICEQTSAVQTSRHPLRANSIWVGLLDNEHGEMSAFVFISFIVCTFIFIVILSSVQTVSPFAIHTGFDLSS